MTEAVKRGLRRRLRAARRAVGAPERAAAAAAIDRGLARLGLPRPGTRIAAFQPYDGEIDPSAILRHRRAWRRPLLLGLAFDLQRVDRLPAQPHDVRLWGVLTERGVYGRAAQTR